MRLITVIAAAASLFVASCTGGPHVGPSPETTSTKSGARPEPSASANPATLRPFAGLLLIADRGNNRLLVVDATKHVLWRYPSPKTAASPIRFYYPDDAFWVHHGHAILMNEEDNEVLVEIAYPSGRVLWSYGHPGVSGAGRGYLHQPDDVYPLPGGGMVVADAGNCRLLFFDSAGRVVRQLGMTGSPFPPRPDECVHDLPRRIGYPNGDTPLPNGDLLMSELRGGWVDEITPLGRVVWATHIRGVALPSDPQALPDGTFLVVDYETPGKVVRFTRQGKVLWEYGPSSGPGELHNPSLGTPLPNGLVAVTDDLYQRVLIIDPATDRIVWVYGHAGRPGTSPGFINEPDGLDLLFPDGTTPLHIDFSSGTTQPGRP